jgi:hypothetical protein
VKLRTIGLAFVATAFMAGSALAQSGTMQPIPNPPEKSKSMHHKMKHKAMMKGAPATADQAEAKTAPKAAPATADQAEAKTAPKAATPPKK